MSDSKGEGHSEDNELTTRTVLVAVAGGSPAIITETLWALTHQKREHIHEIRIITTRKGEERILNTLLSTGAAIFEECCRECGYEPGEVKFDRSTIEVLRDALGAELEDIRNDEENQLAADQICGLIEKWTAEDDVRLFCSVAGGRKTMSIYLTIAMMLYGRADDRLWHVLVEPEELERCREFFYPYKQPRDLPITDSRGKTLKLISTAAARIDLSNIPFVRLRDLATVELTKEPRSYNRIVDETQERLQFLAKAEDAPLYIHKVHGAYSQIPLQVAGSVFYLSTAEGLLYALIAERRKNAGDGDEGLMVTDIKPDDLKRIYYMLTGERYESSLRGTDFGFLTDWIEQTESRRGRDLVDFKEAVERAVSRANKSLRANGLPGKFLVVNVNRRRRRQAARYALQLPPEAIHLCEKSLEK
jgi:CRISPR-associated protein (TIGR02584 family)